MTDESPGGLSAYNRPGFCRKGGEREHGRAVRLIKKYPNRRLYDTKTSSYITLADVKELVLKTRNSRWSTPRAAKT
jgi:polyhydroxyalkanoate synthesis regulator protein